MLGFDPGHARPSRRRALGALSSAVGGSLLCVACAVGPNFKHPEPPRAARLSVQPLPARTVATDAAGGAAQRFVAGERIPAQWWTLFHSPPLDALIEQALAANPTVQSAQAALRQAHENFLADRGVLAPSVDLTANGARERISGAEFGEPGEAFMYNLFNASVNVSYALDVFGGARRELEALRAQTSYQRYALEATYLTLAANVVTSAITEASLRAQIEATEQLVEASSRRLEVVERQQRLGGASGADVLAQRTELAQDRASLPGLRDQLDRQRSLLASLLGRLPSDQPQATFRLADLELPESVPVSLPSQLVSQRPDVQEQQELLHQASAQVGVATANLLPQLTLSASYGGTATQSSALFESASRIWSAGAGITQPLFHGGQLLHQRRAAIAAYDEAAAQYRGTVLTAFRNVADSLHALVADAETFSAQNEAEQSAADDLALTDRQYALGAVSFLTLLNAQRAERQARLLLIQARAARLADTAALIQALGGGWWNRGATRLPPSGPASVQMP
ncbi:MAG TPA: efflux transporter outer membrane subunit [Steroidobacteraceae bacterium]|nr:efflux transporter outer membrane subunit [Steroidobacteraceae bacterium]